MSAFRTAAFALVVLALPEGARAKQCFAAMPRTRGTYAGQAPRQFQRVKWKFTTGDGVVSSPVYQVGQDSTAVLHFRQALSTRDEVLLSW